MSIEAFSAVYYQHYGYLWVSGLGTVVALFCMNNLSKRWPTFILWLILMTLLEAIAQQGLTPWNAPS
jgi:MFS superfamily sulfate permease-like transporter